MSLALTLTGIALVSLIAAGILTVITVGISELFCKKKNEKEN